MKHAAAVPILHQRDSATDVRALTEAWCSSATFIFVPAKSGVALSWLEGAVTSLPGAYSADHFALLTSGSTGRPKLIVGRRQRAEHLARILHDVQDSECVEETIVALPLTYCYAFVNQWLWARVHDRRLVMTEGLSRPDRLGQTLAEASNAMLCLVGAQVPMLLHHFGGTSFPGVLRLHFAGGQFPQRFLPDLRQMFPECTIFNNYGCAEAMPRLTLRRADAANEAHHVGWPLPGVELRATPVGELHFRSIYGAVGQVDETGFSPIEGETWVPTGDLACQGEAGEQAPQDRGHHPHRRCMDLSQPAVQLLGPADEEQQGGSTG